ncbi:hypothetical protein [Glycomyces xiaoerkulensis]|uniref:hypothetical protein n=1 Tax=Glycomyces xiaoerkulensis TaxID=2038139 RepID=UPI0012FFF448|nr:hypothetical protein [Glycomyces xiaoerkulensis]
MPHSARRPPQPEPSYAWRISFEQPEVDTKPDPEPRTGRRLLQLLGLAYLMLAALASGLAWTAYFTDRDDREGRDCDGQSEPQTTTPPAEPPEPDPNAPGLHTRPDGSRYLIVPISPGLDGRRRPIAAIAPGGAA